MKPDGQDRARQQAERLLKERAYNLEARILRNEPMAKHTTYRIGGPTDFYFEPHSEQELIQIMQVCRQGGLPFTVVGKGSNLLVSDEGVRGMVVSLGDSFADYSVYRPGEEGFKAWADCLGPDLVRGDMYYLYAEAGLSMTSLAKRCAKSSMAGLTFACGIPGTLGGAVYMNAGAYGNQMADVVVATRYLDADLQVRQLVGEAHSFAYRKSFFKDHPTYIIGSLLMLPHGSTADLLAEQADYTERRKTTQPLELPSAGSVFKRPVGFYAGKLISDSGFRGYTVGGAAVSEKHAGFIVNCGGATAHDVLTLMAAVRQGVKEHFDVLLEPEQRFLGEGDPELLVAAGLVQE